MPQLNPEGRPTCSHTGGTMRCTARAVWWVTGRPTCHPHLRVVAERDLVWLERDGPRYHHVLHVEPIADNPGGGYAQAKP